MSFQSCCQAPPISCFLLVALTETLDVGSHAAALCPFFGIVLVLQGVLFSAGKLFELVQLPLLGKILRLCFFINSILPLENYREKRIIERYRERCYLQEAIFLIREDTEECACEMVLLQLCFLPF